jgi:hypothetical protein
MQRASTNNSISSGPRFLILVCHVKVRIMLRGNNFIVGSPLYSLWADTAVTLAAFVQQRIRKIRALENL